MKNEAVTPSKTFEELRKKSQFMLQQRQVAIDENCLEGRNTVAALRKKKENTSKISELAHAIIAECSQHRMENQEILGSMESHGQNILEKNVAQIEVWESIFQRQEDIAMKALDSLNELKEKTNSVTEYNVSSAACALKEIRSKVSEGDNTIKGEGNNFMTKAASIDKAGYNDVKNIMDSINRFCEELRSIKDETENNRLLSREDKAKREKNIVQEVWDRVVIISKGVSDMVEDNRQNTDMDLLLLLLQRLSRLVAGSALEVC